MSVLVTVNEQRRLKARSYSCSALCSRPPLLECGFDCCGFNARTILKRLCLNRASPGLTHSKNSLLTSSVRWEPLWQRWALIRFNPSEKQAWLIPLAHLLSDNMTVTLAAMTQCVFVYTGHRSTPRWRSALAHHSLHNICSETRGSGSCHEGKFFTCKTIYLLLTSQKVYLNMCWTFLVQIACTCSPVQNLCAYTKRFVCPVSKFTKSVVVYCFFIMFVSATSFKHPY